MGLVLIGDLRQEEAEPVLIPLGAAYWKLQLLLVR